MTDLPYPEAVVEGFTLGMFVSYGDCGDAWVRAPDGGVAGLIWERVEPRTFAVAIPPDPTGRWGTYAVNLPLPLTTDAEAAAYLRELLPELRPRWEAWQKIRPSRSQRFRTRIVRAISEYQRSFPPPARNGGDGPRRRR